MTVRTGRTGWVLAALATALIALATLRPLPGTVPYLEYWCVFCGELAGTDFVLNVVLFAPLGVGLGLTSTRARVAALYVVGLTVAIELLQYALIPGRDASLRDVLANTAGGIAGFIAARYAGVWITPTVPAARRLAGVAALAWLLLTAVTSFLLVPHTPLLDYGSQWQPEPRDFVPFRGRLLALSLNGMPMPPATYVHTATGVEPLTGDSVHVQAVVIAGPEPEAISAIARLGRAEWEAYLVARDHDALLFRTRLRSADARFRVPMLRLAHAFSRSSERDTIQVSGRLAGHELSIRVMQRAVMSGRVLPLTPGLGWAFVLPRNVGLGRWADVVSLMWMCITFLPIAHWTRRATNAQSPGSVALVMLPLVVLMALGLVVAPAAASTHVAGVGEWAGCLLALLAGFRLTNTKS